MGIIEMKNRRRRAVQERDKGIPSTVAVALRLDPCGLNQNNITAYITTEDDQYRLNQLGDFNQGPGENVATLWADSQRTKVVSNGYYKFLFDPPSGGFNKERVYYVSSGYILGWIECTTSGGGGIGGF